MDIKNPIRITKSTFKDISFSGMLNRVTDQNLTANYVEIISTPFDGKVKHARVFQIALNGYGVNLPSQQGDGKCMCVQTVRS